MLILYFTVKTLHLFIWADRLICIMIQVLWPECGWQPISLTDLIAAAAVKKVYRKATLCIHPDKVQQKGANLQQKYVAEKVFDLLKVFSGPRSIILLSNYVLCGVLNPFEFITFRWFC